MKKICLLLGIFGYFLTPSSIFAEYVLPYPSFMPGNKLYRVTRVIDTVKGYWSFGNLTQMKYHMQLSDKYLVEAKTLFEYKQYTLASDALNRSDLHIGPIHMNFSSAKQKGIDMEKFRMSICAEMTIHTLVLSALEKELPETFAWQDEKKEAIMLPIQQALHQSLQKRNAIKSRLLCT